MFFRHEKPHQPTFDERLTNLGKFSFSAQRDSANRAIVTRKGCGAVVEDLGNGKVKIGKAGVIVGNEIAMVVHGGYQMFLQTPSGKVLPALASHLEGLHDFDEDLREGLGLTSLYNLSLGTVADEHLYDRVEARDRGPQHRPWDK